MLKQMFVMPFVVGLFVCFLRLKIPDTYYVNQTGLKFVSRFPASASEMEFLYGF